MSAQPQKPLVVLFLDDNQARHASFRQIVPSGVHVTYVWTAQEAIAALDAITFQQAFLDHDLSEEDIMVEVGNSSRVPTGMTVVDHIVVSGKCPPQVVIHSCNEPAAIEMERRLRSRFCTGDPQLVSSWPSIVRLAFPRLIDAALAKRAKVN